jgi:hypothetical protein
MTLIATPIVFFLIPTILFIFLCSGLLGLGHWGGRTLKPAVSIFHLVARTFTCGTQLAALHQLVALTCVVLPNLRHTPALP